LSGDFVTEPVATEVKAPPFEIRKGKRQAPWKVLLYGVPSIGKSTLASYAPKPFFLDLENGLDRVDCESVACSGYEDVLAKLQWFVTSDYQTIVFDTVGEIDKMLAQRVCTKGNKESLADFGYGKDGVLMAAAWHSFMDILSRVQLRGKNVILVGHEQVETVKDPTSENYDRYSPNINKKALTTVVAKMDAVLFARYEILLKEKETAEGKMRAVGTGKRLLYCQDSPAYVAKNRFGLPDKVPMERTIFEKLV
jgi:hypothetical protein